MRLDNQTVLYIFIVWLAIVALRLAFNLYRSYRRENHRATVTRELLANPSTSNALGDASLLECASAGDPIVPESISRGRLFAHSGKP